MRFARQPAPPDAVATPKADSFRNCFCHFGLRERDVLLLQMRFAREPAPPDVVAILEAGSFQSCSCHFGLRARDVLLL